MKFIIYILSVSLLLVACKVQKVKRKDIVLTTIDSISLSQIRNIKITGQSIYDYYESESYDEVAIWSDKMFGRCCTEADLSYSELLDFNISTNKINKTHPKSNLSDTKYSTAYAFNKNENTEIYLKLDRNNEFHDMNTYCPVDDILKVNDTILKPFRLSLVNGFTKSEETFKQNGRVKEMKVLLNNSYKGTVLLKDSPLVQEFEVDFIFSKNDIVTLIPISYYKGTKHNTIYISEIQKSMAHITHPSLNKKYIIYDIYMLNYEKNK